MTSACDGDCLKRLAALALASWLHRAADWSRGDATRRSTVLGSPGLLALSDGDWEVETETQRGIASIFGCAQSLLANTLDGQIMAAIVYFELDGS